MAKYDLMELKPGKEADFSRRIASSDQVAERVRRFVDKHEAPRKRTVGIVVREHLDRGEWKKIADETADDEVVLAAPQTVFDSDAKALIETGRHEIPDRLRRNQIVFGDDDRNLLLEIFIGDNDLGSLPHLGADDDPIAPSPTPAAHRLTRAQTRHPVSMLERRELEVLARSVCMIEVHSRPVGTGTLIGQDLILTARHVLDSDDRIHAASAVFDFRAHNHPIVRRRLLPCPEFVVQDNVDAVVVRVSDVPGTRPRVPLEVEASDRPAVGDEAVILQHPAGQALSVALKNIEITAVDHRRFQYETDTHKGSSGAPVFVRGRLQLIGIHLRGGWLPAIGKDADYVLTNEGLLASAIPPISSRR